MARSPLRPAKGNRAPQRERTPAFDFLRQAPQLTDLVALDRAFREAIAREGFTSFVFDHAGEDAPTRPEGFLLEATGWEGRRERIRLLGGAKPDRAAAARLHLLATVYATRREALVDRDGDLPTDAGVGLFGRQLLGQLLIGTPAGEVARLTKRSPLAIEYHLDAALAATGASSAAQAIALAARRGWLLSFLPDGSGSTAAS